MRHPIISGAHAREQFVVFMLILNVVCENLVSAKRPIVTMRSHIDLNGRSNAIARALRSPIDKETLRL